MWQKRSVSVCGSFVMVAVFQFICGLLKVRLLLLYGIFFALLPTPLRASGLRLRVSPVFRSSLRLKYRGQSCASNADFSDLQACSDQGDMLDDLSYGDRIFADGYVCQDEGTGKPGTVLPDSTWNWGYHSASQYDAENQTLTFRKPVQVRQERLEQISGRTAAERKSDRADEHCGLEFSVEIPLAEVFSPASSLSVGWQWIPGWQEQAKFRTFNHNYLTGSSLLDAEDHYVYATFGAELPPPGHAGCSEGPFADPPSPGTLIANRPFSVERVFSGTGQVLTNGSISLRNQVRFQLECEQQEFWFGPVFRWLPFPSLSCSISPRCNLLYSAVELKREEKLCLSSSEGRRELLGYWRHRREGQRLLTGASLSATMESAWENGFFAGLNLSASWYPDNLELRAGPGRVSIRPGTFCAGAIFGYRF